jgi:hypothetical protein
VGSFGFAVSLREKRDFVARHLDHSRIHPRLKQWHSAVGVNSQANIFSIEHSLELIL